LNSQIEWSEDRGHVAFDVVLAFTVGKLKTPKGMRKKSRIIERIAGFDDIPRVHLAVTGLLVGL
jgi:hypothetical protein